MTAACWGVTITTSFAHPTHQAKLVRLEKLLTNTVSLNSIEISVRFFPTFSVGAEVVRSKYLAGQDPKTIARYTNCGTPIQISHGTTPRKLVWLLQCTAETSHSQEK